MISTPIFEMGDPIGPMALEVSVQTEAAGGTRLRVTQTGFEEGVRWRRYYEIIGFGWNHSLKSLKSLLENKQGLGTGGWGLGTRS